MSKRLPHNNFEALHLHRPETVAGHRLAIFDAAVRNLRPHAYLEMPAAVQEQAPAEAPRTSVQEPESTIINQKAAQFRQDTSVDRIMQNVDAIYEGQGNPLYDQETV